MADTTVLPWLSFSPPQWNSLVEKSGWRGGDSIKIEEEHSWLKTVE